MGILLNQTVSLYFPRVHLPDNRHKFNPRIRVMLLMITGSPAPFAV